MDLKYVAGAEADCRDFRCCHANNAGELNISPRVEAGVFGSKNCDLPLNGARILLTKLKEKLMAEYQEINMIVVTGNVVSDQPG